MASACTVIQRGISTSCVCNGKRNFNNLLLYNKRGSRAFKQQQAKNPDPDVPIDHRGVRKTGFKINNRFVTIPEMVPELIVPSLKDFKLKPYVSYKVEDFEQAEFTPKHLFTLVYGPKIKEDFKNGQLGSDGEPLQPSENEKLTPQEAKNRAAQTGSDIFCM